MERLIKLLGDGAVRMLTTQYRMNEAIMKWSSEKLYEGRLKADSSVKSHLLKDLPGVQETDETSLPLLLIDTAGCDVREKEVEDEVSKGNEGEADIVAAHVVALITAGLQPSDIAVIAPYNLQVEFLRLRVSSAYPALEIKSVDGFQGREKEAVVISLVRSNKKGEVGFLAEHRRINVAITRARRHLAIVADSETVSHDDFLKSLVEYMSSEGEVRSAHEYLQDSCTNAVDSYSNSNEQDEVLLTQSTRDYKKKKGLNENKTTVPKENNAKGRDETEVVDTVENRSINNEGDSSTTESVPQQGSAKVTSEPPACNERISTKPGKKEINKPLQSGSNTATAKCSRETLEKEILDFIQDGSKFELTFPKTLNSQQRFDVHSIAEKLSLCHESRGEGKERYIVVRKAKPASKDEEDSELVTTCSLCKKRVPSCNIQLHSLRCEQIMRSNLGESSKLERSEEKRAGTNSKPQKNKAKTRPVKQPEEDFDKMLASFTKLDTQCAFNGCKQSIRTLGQLCKCCERTYCLSHHIPEVHGCGEAAKVRARQLASKPKGATPKALDATRKVQLHRKLDKKLDEMSEQRKSKRKDRDH